MKKYMHIYFDLDRTLWDFKANSRQALEDVFMKYNLDNVFTDKDEFVEIYHMHNENLWEMYRNGKVTKAFLRTKRFELTLEEKKINDSHLASRMGKEYLELSVLKTNLFPGTHEILNYLKPSYNLYILTNGFRETQVQKLQNCDLEKYFDEIFTSETIGYNKPHSKIFQWAVTAVNAKKKDCLMIGDDQQVDIKGAKSYGLDTVFFNPENEQVVEPADYIISELIELKKIL